MLKKDIFIGKLNKASFLCFVRFSKFAKPAVLLTLVY